MTTDNDFTNTETLLRQRLAQLADHAPTAVHQPDEVPVVASYRPERHRRRRAGVVAAVTALIGAGGFTTYSFLGASNSGGAATPEEAVTAFVAAVEQEDILGVIDVALPEEVDVMRNAVESVTTDAKRLGLLDDRFATNAVSGLDISFENLQLETTQYDGGLAAVLATGGTVAGSFDPETFPFGEKMRDLLDGNTEASTATARLGQSDPPALVMTVERNGRWYVSLEYTLAEYVRLSAGWEVPGPVDRTPVGFGSPEAAANAFYERLAAFDLQAAIDTFAPGEDAMAWLAPMWVPDAQAAAEQAHADGWSLKISGLTYETTGDGARRVLKPLTFTATGTAPADYSTANYNTANPSFPTVVFAVDGSGYAVIPAGQLPPATIEGLEFAPEFPTITEYNITEASRDGKIRPLTFPPEPASAPKPFTIERADGCTTFTGEFAESLANVGFAPYAEPRNVSNKVCVKSGGSLGLAALWLSGGALAELPDVSVVQRDGKWYVSPLGTAFATVVAGFRGAGDEQSVFDTAMAPYFYNGVSRDLLESMVVGQSVDDIDSRCLPALVIDNGQVTGVVPDPPKDAVQVCADAASSDGYSAQTGTYTVDVAPASVPPPPPPPASVPEPQPPTTA
jgi:hypothetical protein